MSKGLFPTFLAESAYDIDYASLYEKGYRFLLFDIDYTLVPYCAPAEKRTITLFSKLRELGFSCGFVSNNHLPRVRAFNEKFGFKYVVDARKPLKKGFIKAMEKLGGTSDTTLAIGDQIFTDVLGANVAGIDNVLVGRVVPAGELQLKLKSILEKLILFTYKKINSGKEIYV